MQIQTIDMFILGLWKEQNNTKERKTIWWQNAAWHILANKTCKSSANTVISDEWQVMHKFMFIQRQIAAILAWPKKRKCTQTPAYHTFRTEQHRRVIGTISYSQIDNFAVRDCLERTNFDSSLILQDGVNMSIPRPAFFYLVRLFQSVHDFNI